MPSEGDASAHISKVEETLSEKDAQLKELLQLNADLQSRLATIESSPIWALYRRYQHIESGIFPEGSFRRRIYLSVLDRILSRTPLSAGTTRELSRLFLFGPSTLDDNLRSAAKAWVAGARVLPKLSILLPSYNSNPAWLEEAVTSVTNQLYPNWELCIVDDASTRKSHFPIIEKFAKNEKRIRIRFLEENLGISGALNRALEMVTGDFVGFLDHDDELALDALLEFAKAINSTGEDFYYSDEAHADQGGNIFDLVYRPDFSLDFLLSHQYIVHFCMFRTSIAKEVRFREHFRISQDYDFILRFLAKTKHSAYHIPKVLYKWRNIPASHRASYRYRHIVNELGVRALSDYAKLAGIDAVVEPTKTFNFYRFKRSIRGRHTVSIIIPVRNRSEVLRTCISSIESRTDFENYEIIIVDNGSDDPKTVEYLRSLPYKVIQHDAPFNYSELNNIGAKNSTGDHLLFLNNDVEVIRRDWLSSMVEHSQRPEVGAVGAKLTYPDRRIQHAGVVLGLFGICEHLHKFGDSKKSGYLGSLISIRNFSAVTAACLMIRRSVFDEVGGFDQSLRINYNDVDLCLRIRENGYLIVYTPYAELVHYEHSTRRTIGGEVNTFPEDTALFMNRWQTTIVRGDPYYNPNLSLFSWTPRPDFTPLAVLQLIYRSRRDLQNAFPESAKGDNRRLVEWAASQGIKEETLLKGYAGWYSRMASC